MKRESWYKRDIALLQKLKEEDEKLKLYFDKKNGKILCDDKLIVYDKRIYHQWVQNEIKVLQNKLDTYIRNQKCNQKYFWYQMKPLCVEEKLGRLMTIRGTK